MPNIEALIVQDAVGSSQIPRWSQILKSTGLRPFRVTGVSLLSTGTSVIGTTTSGQGRFFPLFVVALLTSGAVTTPATFSVGTNGASYNNILAAAAIAAGVTAPDQYEIKGLLGVALSSVSESTEIRVNVTVAATGTSPVATFELLGFYGNT